MLVPKKTNSNTATPFGRKQTAQTTIPPVHPFEQHARYYAFMWSKPITLIYGGGVLV